MLSEVRFFLTDLLMLCEVASFLVYGVFWWGEDQKSRIIKGYVLYAMIIGLISFVIQITIFADFEIPFWGRFLIAIGLSLIFTKSPLYPMVAKNLPTTDEK